MTRRDDLLRAAVYVAFDARDGEDQAAYRAALDRVIFVHATWPLIEYEQAMLLAELKVRERDG